MAEESAQVEALQETPVRGRRAAAERTERRRRGGNAEETGALAVPAAIKRKLADEGKDGRWINDIGNRMHQKTVLDDWDKVPGVDPVPVGVDRMTGKPILAYFCAKPSEFLAADNAERMSKLKQAEKARFSGADNGELNEGAYTPKSARNYVGTKPPS